MKPDFLELYKQHLALHGLSDQVKDYLAEFDFTEDVRRTKVLRYIQAQLGYKKLTIALTAAIDKAAEEMGIHKLNKWHNNYFYKYLNCCRPSWNTRSRDKLIASGQHVPPAAKRDFSETK
jgi:hypothetical protein